jgi:hypothetical protein
VPEKVEDMAAADGSGFAYRRVAEEFEEETEIGAVGIDGIAGQPFFGGQVMEKKVSQDREVLIAQGCSSAEKFAGRAGTVSCRRTGRTFAFLHLVFQAVKLAKFTEGFGTLAAFFHTGFFIVLPPFEFTLDSVDLQFLLELADRIFKVALHFYFDHLQSHPLECFRRPCRLVNKMEF